ncbi:hypothetical protein C1H57_17390 [Clostridium sp. 2-1]|uniref:hypothetical protein n=1 Tax=Clostridium TaxID=1485 RepID=UPI000CDAFD25|nr:MULTISPECIES: hypothetical protein [Clostridium]MBN7576235.1 hypothetical protein [Clostridium beijerinckii]MBN7581309.1 hypothetical protein [Clostridium beijerinckii]MBN7586004.1 hypothetical protein [Clostridium beijerinckii]MBO0521929.1 hypothetical protein [Clostridium beijerinckii]POO90034.1 hypothetical protein C1H57_17390 [Clostridium sp. 2-1]
MNRQWFFRIMCFLQNNKSITANLIYENSKEQVKLWKQINDGKDGENRIKFALKTLELKNVVKKVDVGTWSKGNKFDSYFKKLIQKIAHEFQFEFILNGNNYDDFKYNDYLEYGKEFKDIKFLTDNDFKELRNYLQIYDLVEENLITLEEDEEESYNYIVMAK